MDWSDRHCRFFWRLLSKHALAYTEMVTTGALLNGDTQRFLRFDMAEKPLALQLGGSDPAALAQCAAMAEDCGYDEVNLNCGCPSDRVQEGKIGAILMAEPSLVGECVAAMRDNCSLPVTVKHRIGIDDMDDYPAMLDFVQQVHAQGCSTFIVHARKAWLQGLSPKQNREVPPLCYQHVYQLKQAMPELTVVINGGITTIAQCLEMLEHVDGVMIGREAYHNPYLLAEVDSALFNDLSPLASREDVLAQYTAYCREQMLQGTALHHMSRHILGLFAGQPGARRFRRYITEHVHKPGVEASLLMDALGYMQT